MSEVDALLQVDAGRLPPGVVAFHPRDHASERRRVLLFSAVVTGLCALVYWIASAAAGEGAYARVHAMFGQWWFRVLLLSWLAAYCYHFCNGIRHLAWDAGWGLEKTQARRTAKVVMAVAVLAFLALAYVLCCPRAVLP